MSATGWAASGLCHGTTDWLADTADYRALKARCHRCPVELECARYAVSVDISHGVVGGLGPRERRNVRAVHPHVAGDPRVVARFLKHVAQADQTGGTA